MKKCILFLLPFVLVFALAACRTDVPTKKFCGNCNGAVSAADVCCGHCGMLLEKVCSACDGLIPFTAAVCEHCSAPAEVEESTDAAEREKAFTPQAPQSATNVPAPKQERIPKLELPKLKLPALPKLSLPPLP